MNTQNWREKIRKGDNETGIYHVDGIEYNLSEDTLIAFIEALLSEKERDTYLKAAEEACEVIDKVDIEAYYKPYDALERAKKDITERLTSLGISSDKKE